MLGEKIGGMMVGVKPGGLADCRHIAGCSQGVGFADCM